MSDFKPGTVAMVTYQDARHMAIRDTHGWFIPGPHQGDAFNVWTHNDDRDDRLTDIRPLVVLDLTREDADVLTRWLDSVGPRRPSTTASNAMVNVVVSVIVAIREQLPAPRLLTVEERVAAALDEYEAMNAKNEDVKFGAMAVVKAVRKALAEDGAK